MKPNLHRKTNGMSKLHWVQATNKTITLSKSWASIETVSDNKSDEFLTSWSSSTSPVHFRLQNIPFWDWASERKDIRPTWSSVCLCHPDKDSFSRALHSKHQLGSRYLWNDFGQVKFVANWVRIVATSKYSEMLIWDQLQTKFYPVARIQWCI